MQSSCCFKSPAVIRLRDEIEPVAFQREQQDLRLGRSDPRDQRAKILFLALGEFLADNAAAELADHRLRRLEHAVRPGAVGPEQEIGVAEGAAHVGQQLSELLIGNGAERKNVPTALAAFVVGGIEQRRLQALDRGRDRIQISRGDRPDDGQHAVALDQLARRIQCGRRIGLVVLVDHFHGPAEDPARLRLFP